MKNFYQVLTFFFCFQFIPQIGVAQSGLCTPDVPFYNVDITTDPAGLWQSSPPIVRRGDCCGSSWPDRCIEFEILLHPDAVAINFEILSGAVPGGAMFYQIGCGPLTKVGDPICVNGPGPHVLTFCKPGSNLNTYGITSIPGPKGSPDTKTSDGCTTTLSASGLNNIVWKDITSTDERYNSYLSCITTNCDSVLVTPQLGYPSFVDYQVCGEPNLGPCYPYPQFCDTVRVNFVPPLNDSIYPNPAVYCETESGITITGGISGGQAPYTFIWTDQGGQFLSNDSSYFAAEGTYNLEIRDALYPDCPAKYLTGSVSKELSPIVDAGPDVVLCANFPTASINASVVNSNNYSWSGSGVFGSALNSLTNTYTPTAAEITAGSAQIYFTANALGVCNPVTDTVDLIINPALEVQITAPPYVCFGEKVDLSSTITGGTAPYLLTWNTGEMTSAINGKDPGSFSVSVTDASGTTCSANAAAVVNENPEITLIVPNLTTIICDSSAIVTAVAVGGSGNPYRYLWSNGKTDSSVTLFVGSYTVQASDWTGCSVSKPVNVQAVNSDLNVDFPPISNLCFGTSMSLSANVSNGFPPYTYAWDSGESSSTKVATAGFHCLTVTDSAGCIRTACVTIGEDSLLTLAISGPIKVCSDSASTISAIVQGGRPSYSYAWSTGSTDSIVDLLAGSYSITVTDDNPNSCTASQSVIIQQALPLLVNLSQDSVLCYGDANGVISSSINGGTAPYTYDWSTGATSSGLSGLSSGDYILKVTDSLSCLDFDTIQVLSPDSMSAIINSFIEPLCNGDANGKANVITTGGTRPFSYNWGTSLEIDSNASKLASGLNTVTVTDSKGCSDKANVIITEPLPLSLTFSSTNVACKDGSSGSAIAHVTGGSLPYTFVWVHNLHGDSSITNLAAGTYEVLVIDNFGCSITDSITITEPDSLIGDVIGIKDALCDGSNDGEATIKVTGGIPPYQYNWSNGEVANVNSTLDSGWHSFSVLDGQNCLFIDSIFINDPAELQVVSSSPAPINCDSSLSIFASGNGGTVPYSYLWGGGETTDTITVNSSGNFYVQVTDSNGCTVNTTVNVYPLISTLDLKINGPTDVCFGDLATLTPLITPGVAPYQLLWNSGKVDSIVQESTGLHCLTVKDAVGCTVSECINVQEHSVLLTSMENDTVCIGTSGSITSTTTGGLIPYYYSWSNGEVTKDIIDKKGVYYLTVSDSINCTVKDTVEIVELLPLTISFPKYSSESCKGLNNGYINSTVSGGLAPYTYQWSTGSTNPNITGISSGSFVLTITDKLGCSVQDSIFVVGPATDLSVTLFSSNVTCKNAADGKLQADVQGGLKPYNYLWWETNDTVSTVSSLGVGTYNFSVVDSAGCIRSDIISINEPDSLVGQILSSSAVLCNGDATGKAEIGILGGTSPINITWSDGGSGFVRNNLLFGEHTFTINDKNGCSFSDSIVISQPASIVTTVSSDAYITCDSTSLVFVQASGGVGNYQYQWASGQTSDSVFVTGSGNYIVTVSDSNGCSVIDTAFVYPLNSVLNVEILGPNKICLGDSVLLSLNVTPGINPITFEWTGGSTQTTFMSYGGTQCVTATDSVQCKHTDCIDVSLSPPLVVSVENDSICYNETGNLAVNITGGVTPFSVVWSNGNTNQTIQAKEGSYIVSVTDNIGCVEVDTAVIWQNDSIIITENITNNLCKGEKQGEISTVISGGTQPYSIAWSGTLSSITTLTNLEGGSYQITVVDDRNCRNDKTIVVTEPDSSLSMILTGNIPVCFGDCNGVISSKVLGGTRPYRYNWSNGSSSEINSNLCKGTYNLNVQDANNCNISENNFVLNQPEKVELTKVSKTNSSCNNLCDGTIIIESQNAFEYSIDRGLNYGSDSIFATLCPATYFVYARNNSNCIDSTAIVITNPSKILITGPKDTLVCYGSTIDLAAFATGGTGNKSYYWNGVSSTNILSATIKSDTLITVYAQDAKGCTSETLSINIKVKPPLNIVSSNDTTICIGDTLSLTALASGGNERTYSYSWINSLGQVIDTSSTIIIAPKETSNMVIKVSDNCGSQPAYDTVNIIVEGGETVDITYSLSPICLPAIAKFELTGLDSSASYSYEWKIADITYSSNVSPSVEFTKSGSFDVSIKVTSSTGCVFGISKPDLVKLGPNPIANFNSKPLSTTILEPTFSFTDKSVNATKLNWSLDYNGRTIIKNPSAVFDSIACFPITLVAENETGCIDSVTNEICVEDVYRFYAPNAFTPDDDGINDFFVTKWHLLDIEDFEFFVFDRWGLLIFQTTDPYDYWDGTYKGRIVQQDVYVWKARTRDVYGTNYSYVGTVTVVR